MYKHYLIFIILYLTISKLPAIDKGNRYYWQEDFESARAYYEAILQKAPANRAAQFGLGVTAFKQLDLETAQKAFEQTLSAKDPKLKAKAYYNLGNTLYQQQRPEESLAFFRKAIELDPNDMDAKYNYELLRYQMEQQKQQQQKNGQDQKDRQNQDQQQDQEQSDSKKQGEKDQQDQQSDQSQKKNNEQQDQQQQQAEQNKEPEQMDQEQSQKSQMNQEEESANKQSARAMLDAMKDDEKIYMKKQIARAKSKKLEKDW